MEVHGSKEAMESFVASQNEGKLGIHRSLVVRWLTRSPPLRPPKFADEADEPIDQFCGMASTVFPCLQPKNVPESVFCCLGCLHIFNRYFLTREMDSDINLLVADSDPMISTMRALWGLKDRARTKPEFLQHVRGCIGVRRRLERFEQERQSA